MMRSQNERQRLQFDGDKMIKIALTKSYTAILPLDMSVPETATKT